VQGPTTTILWRDLNRPEQQLMGVQFSGTAPYQRANAPYVVKNSSSWVYGGTGLADGDSIPKMVGYEMDSSMSSARCRTQSPAPTRCCRSLRSPIPAQRLPRTRRSTRPERAWVFGAGTTSWSWGLSDDGDGYMDPRIQRITANLLRQFGASPSP